MSITSASSASQNQLHTRQADAPELNIEYEVNPFPYSFPTTQKDCLQMPAVLLRFYCFFRFKTANVSHETSKFGKTR